MGLVTSRLCDNEGLILPQRVFMVTLRVTALLVM